MTNLISSGVYIYLLLLVVAVLIAASVNYKRTKQNFVFIVLSICAIGWLSADLAILFVMNIPLNLFIWDNRLIFAAFAALLLFVATFQFFFPERKLSRNLIILLSVMPTLTALMTLTSPFHSLISEVHSFAVWPRTIEYTQGAGFWIHTVSSSSLGLASVVVLIKGISKKANTDRIASALYIVAIAALMVSTILNAVDALPIDINPTSIGAGIAIVFIHLALSDSRYSITFRLFNTLKSRITFPVLAIMFLLVMTIVAFMARSTRLLVEDYEEIGRAHV